MCSMYACTAAYNCTVLPVEYTACCVFQSNRQTGVAFPEFGSDETALESNHSGVSYVDLSGPRTSVLGLRTGESSPCLSVDTINR